jgi:deoxyribodipyrimidine photo-lyase
MSTAKRLQLPCDRNERLRYIRLHFPEAGGPDLSEAWPGGRVEALRRLHLADGQAYERSRNYLDGALTRLSPYLRHGCLTLREAFDHVHRTSGGRAQKLLFEFAWRDYWRQVWYQHGDAILSDMEVAKVERGTRPIPQDVLEGETGLPCMDAFIRDLQGDGYVHNHARMWFAAWLLHWRKVDWRAAADWYAAELLDGDIASNHLSWQWVASTFSAKPYYFNKENLARYSGERFCRTCQAECPFDDSYEALQSRLFDAPAPLSAKRYPIHAVSSAVPAQGEETIVLFHDEMLSPAHALLRHHGPKCFVFEPALHGDWSLKRLQFVADCLSEMEDVQVWQGSLDAVLRQYGAAGVVTQRTPQTDLMALLQGCEVAWQPEPEFAPVALGDRHLKRFSRYWEKVGPLLLGDTAYRKP